MNMCQHTQYALVLPFIIGDTELMEVTWYLFKDLSDGPTAGEHIKKSIIIGTKVTLLVT